MNDSRELVPNLPEEPPYMSVVLDRYGVAWQRVRDVELLQVTVGYAEEWRPPIAPDGHRYGWHGRSLSWPTLLGLCGPLLVLTDGASLTWAESQIDAAKRAQEEAYKRAIGASS